MNKMIFSAALLSLAAASPAFAKPEQTKFTHDGVSYTYSVTSLNADTRIIEGYATPGNAFRLVVSNGRVVGKANGIPVSFNVDSKVAKTVKVASR